MSDLTIDLDATVDFLVGLLNTPSPTGYYIEAMEYVRSAFGLIPGLELRTRTKARWSSPCAAAPPTRRAA